MFLLKDKQRKNYSLRLLISTCKSRESLFEKNMDGKVYCHLLNNVTRVPAKKSPVKPLTYKFYPQAPIFCCYIWDTLYKTSSLYNQYNNQKRKKHLETKYNLPKFERWSENETLFVFLILWMIWLANWNLTIAMPFKFSLQMLSCPISLSYTTCSNLLTNMGG